MTKRLLIVLGTRPDAIKLAPVIAALKTRPELFETIICSTGQHAEMLDQALNTFGIIPDIRLDVMMAGQTLPDLTAKLMATLGAAISRLNPHRVIVQGDTTTAFAAALLAYYEQVPVAHVEAGLRSHDRYAPFPEEINRKMISSIADVHFAPTQRAAEALATEGISRSSVFITGNTVVDALQHFRKRLETKERDQLVSPSTRQITANGHPIVLVSCHRRENFGADLAAICRALARLAQSFPHHRIVFPVHLNPNVQPHVLAMLGSVSNIDLIEPVSYPDLLFLLSCAKLVISDSGGLQEEAPSFRVPVLVLRKTTERPEAVEAGFSFLVGSDEELIVTRASALLQSTGFTSTISANPYGDGHAAERIVDILTKIS